MATGLVVATLKISTAVKIVQQKRIIHGKLCNGYISLVSILNGKTSSAAVKMTEKVPKILSQKATPFFL